MFVLVVGLMVVLLQMALIPILRLYTSGASIGDWQIIPDMDLNGTFLGVWLAHTVPGLPLATYLLRNYIGSLPSSIIESAKIDGADHFTIFWRLVVPLSVRPSRRSPSSSSSGSGTTSSSPTCSWVVRRTPGWSRWRSRNLGDPR